MVDVERRTEPILEISNLRLTIPTYEGPAHILKSIDIRLSRGDILGLVGETGCGKTMTMLAAMRLLAPPAEISADRVSFRGVDLLRMPATELRRLRARHIAMVFQDPETNLNPVLTVGSQMIDIALCRKGHERDLYLGRAGAVVPAARLRREAARDLAISMLDRVGMQDAQRVLSAYPHQLSGGQKQRVLIAMALAGTPELLVADEATTALDVSIQAQILNLVRELVDTMQLSVVWITHNLGVVAVLCNRVAVMYAGTVVEQAPTVSLFRTPKHPYTVSLLNALPTQARRGRPLEPAPGQIPSVVSPPPGCLFSPRCQHVMPRCRQVEPQAQVVGPEHVVRCHLYAPAGAHLTQDT